MEGVVASLQAKYGFELRIVRSNEVPFLRRLFLPAFPSVEIDGRFVSRNRVITGQELEAHVLGLLEGP